MEADSSAELLAHQGNYQGAAKVRVNRALHILHGASTHRRRFGRARPLNENTRIVILTSTKVSQKTRFSEEGIDELLFVFIRADHLNWYRKTAQASSFRARRPYVIAENPRGYFGSFLATHAVGWGCFVFSLRDGWGPTDSVGQLMIRTWCQSCQHQRKHLHHHHHHHNNDDRLGRGTAWRTRPSACSSTSANGKRPRSSRLPRVGPWTPKSSPDDRRSGRKRWVGAQQRKAKQTDFEPVHPRSSHIAIYRGRVNGFRLCCSTQPKDDVFAVTPEHTHTCRNTWCFFFGRKLSSRRVYSAS